jgi:hypothetical protein
MLRLRVRVACPELAEACPEPSRRGLSTNGGLLPRFRCPFVLSVAAPAAESKGERQLSDITF